MFRRACRAFGPAIQMDRPSKFKCSSMMHYGVHTAAHMKRSRPLSIIGSREQPGERSSLTQLSITPFWCYGLTWLLYRGALKCTLPVEFLLSSTLLTLLVSSNPTFAFDGVPIAADRSPLILDASIKRSRPGERRGSGQPASPHHLLPTSRCNARPRSFLRVRMVDAHFPLRNSIEAARSPPDSVTRRT